MQVHIKGTMYGESYSGYNLWSLTWRVQYLEIHINRKMYGDSYTVYNVWRLI